MEILIKATDTTAPAQVVLNEVAELLQESQSRNEKLINKGRTKIDLVGETCLLQITLKEDRQLQIAEPGKEGGNG